MTTVQSLLIVLALVVPLAVCAAEDPAAPAVVLGIDGRPVVREGTEWAQISNPSDNATDLPRVLLIGDSISVNYAGQVRELLKGKYYVDALGTSRSVNDPILADQALMMLKEHQYAVVHFNNGLHGGHLDGEGYLSGLSAFTKILMDNARGAKLIWGSSTGTTQVVDGARVYSAGNQKVLDRNAIALKLMGELGIPVDDLYGAIDGKFNLWSPDGVHLNKDGYQVLANSIAASILPPPPVVEAPAPRPG